MTPAIVKARIRNLREESDLVLAGAASRTRGSRCRCCGTRRIAVGAYDEHRRFTGTALVPCPDHHGNNPVRAT